MMKKTYFKGSLLLGAALLMLTSLSSCKGRTMENMEATGDTVGVVVDMPTEEGTGVIATSDNDPDVVPASTDEPAQAPAPTE